MPRHLIHGLEYLLIVNPLEPEFVKQLLSFAFVYKRILHEISMKTASNFFGQIQNKTKKQLANLAELNRLFLGKNGIFVKIQNAC